MPHLPDRVQPGNVPDLRNTMWPADVWCHMPDLSHGLPAGNLFYLRNGLQPGDLPDMRNRLPHLRDLRHLQRSCFHLPNRLPMMPASPYRTLARGSFRLVRLPSLDTPQGRWDSGPMRHRRGRLVAVMDETLDTRQLLCNRIEQKQQAVRSYLGRERPRRNKLSNISVVGSALAAMLTAGPAFGGTGFTNALQGVFSLEDDSVVWRVLCLGAVLLSVAAALATNFANSHSIGRAAGHPELRPHRHRRGAEAVPAVRGPGSVRGRSARALTAQKRALPGAA
jgi:hypothetical protein